MNLYIQIRDGQPYQHPIMGDNFREAFPDIDVDNLPPEFAKFERVSAPKIGPFEVNDGPIYQWDNGIVKDVWSTRPMTDDEKAAKIAEYQARTPEGWTFDPETLTYTPPEAPPT